MAADLVFDEIRSVIEAGIGVMCLCVCLQRGARCQVQGTIGPETVSFRFNRYMARGRSRPVFARVESMRASMCTRKASPMSKFLPETRKVIVYSPLPAPPTIPAGAIFSARPEK